jgi:glycosyltransferase involved in cell wall biosynthesis
MAVRDGERWLSEAVESVLAQTCSDLELIIIDDGSVDTTAKQLAKISDPRVRTVGQRPAGLTRSLNRALGLARAPLVARLDADDRALPERLELQVRFLAAHPEVGLVGCATREIDPEGRPLGVVRPPTDDLELRRALIRANPFTHSAITARRDALLAVGGYDERIGVAQDYDLWLRLSQRTRLANLPEVLAERRLHPGSISATADTLRLRSEAAIRWRAIRASAYSPWHAVFALQPALTSLVPTRARSQLRRLIKTP